MSSENPPPDQDHGAEREPRADHEHRPDRDRRAARLRRHARSRRAVSARVVVGGPSEETADEGAGDVRDGGPRPDAPSGPGPGGEDAGSGPTAERHDGSGGQSGADEAPEDAASDDGGPARGARAGSGSAGSDAAAGRTAGSGRGRAVRRLVAGLTAQLPRSTSGRVIAGLLVVATAVTGVLGWKSLEARAVDQARDEARSAARDSVAKVLSYDHRHIAKDFSQAKSGLTDSFGAKYAKSEDVVGAPARKYDVTVKANVVESSVVRASPDRVVLLLYVNQETSSNRLDGPRVDLARVRVTMADEDGWKVDDLDAL